MKEWLAFFDDGRIVSIGKHADADAAEEFCHATFKGVPIYWATIESWREKIARPLPLGSAETFAEFL